MKNKIFPIMCIFLIIVCSLFTNVKATDDTEKKIVTSKGDIYILPNECTENFFICEGFNSTISLIYGNYPDWKFSENNGDVVVNNINGSSVQNFMCYIISKGSYDFRNPINKFTTTWTTINPLKNVSYAGCHILYSTNNLYYPSGEIFFQKPLLGIKETLVVETEKAQIMEQIKIMIAGFLKYLIALVISVIAFYKGWKFLSMQLRKS